MLKHCGHHVGYLNGLVPSRRSPREKKDQHRRKQTASAHNNPGYGSQTLGARGNVWPWLLVAALANPIERSRGGAASVCAALCSVLGAMVAQQCRLEHAELQPSINTAWIQPVQQKPIKKGLFCFKETVSGKSHSFLSSCLKCWFCCASGHKKA